MEPFCLKICFYLCFSTLKRISIDFTILYRHHHDYKTCTAWIIICFCWRNCYYNGSLKVSPRFRDLRTSPDLKMTAHFPVEFFILEFVEVISKSIRPSSSIGQQNQRAMHKNVSVLSGLSALLVTTGLKMKNIRHWFEKFKKWLKKKPVLKVRDPQTKTGRSKTKSRRTERYVDPWSKCFIFSKSIYG